HDGVFFLIVHPLLVERVALRKRLGGIVRPDRGNKGDLLAVARPDAVPRASADRGELLRLAAVHGNDPEVVRAAATGFKEDVLAVGAPARMAVAFRSRGELLGFAGAYRIGGDQPEVLRGAVGFEIDDALYRDDPLAVGADLRIRQTLESE